MTIVTDNNCHGIWRSTVFCHVLQLPSYVNILDTAVRQTVCRELWSFIDNLADTRLADEVCGASGRVSVWEDVLNKTTDIDF